MNINSGYVSGRLPGLLIFISYGFLIVGPVIQCPLQLTLRRPLGKTKPRRFTATITVVTMLFLRSLTWWFFIGLRDARIARWVCPVNQTSYLRRYSASVPRGWPSHTDGSRCLTVNVSKRSAQISGNWSAMARVGTGADGAEPEEVSVRYLTANTGCVSEPSDQRFVKTRRWDASVVASDALFRELSSVETLTAYIGLFLPPQTPVIECVCLNVLLKSPVSDLNTHWLGVNNKCVFVQVNVFHWHNYATAVTS